MSDERQIILFHGFHIHLIKTGEGVVVDIRDPDDDNDWLSSTYAFNHELIANMEKAK